MVIPMVYELKNLSYKISAHSILNDLNCQIKENSFTAIIGPNGAGKSTLIKLLSGETTQYSGAINLFGQSIKNFSCIELSKIRSVLTQNQNNALPFKAYEIVSMGVLNNPNSDIQIATTFMNQTEVGHLAMRNYNSLSGGEVKRVDLARMLAQESKICLLDEPTNHLDPYFQRSLLMKCKSLVSQGVTVIAALHDLNLASLFADEIIVLKDGRLVKIGHPNDVLSVELIKDLYRFDCQLTLHPSGRQNIIML
jgi:iron complex transport system ATP-binding protein